MRDNKISARTGAAAGHACMHAHVKMHVAMMHARRRTCVSAAACRHACASSCMAHAWHGGGAARAFCRSMVSTVDQQPCTCVRACVTTRHDARGWSPRAACTHTSIAWGAAHVFGRGGNVFAHAMFLLQRPMFLLCVCSARACFCLCLSPNLTRKFGVYCFS